LETGRTHQIRVHLAHIKYPIVGDATYGGRLKFPANASLELRETLKTSNAKHYMRTNSDCNIQARGKYWSGKFHRHAI